jgi:predicted Zn-dependent protease
MSILTVKDDPGTIASDERRAALDEARALCRANPGDPGPHLRLIQILAELGDFDGARLAVEVARAAFPGNLWVANADAGLSRQSGDIEAACSKFTFMGSRWPGEPHGIRGLAETLLAAGRTAEAELAFQDAMARFPDDVWSAHGHASVATVRNDWPVAVERWRMVAARFPDHELARGQLALALSSQPGADRSSGAAEPDQAGVASHAPPDPVVSESPRARAEAAVRRSAWPDAIRLWRELIAIDPQPDAYLALCDCECENGTPDAAEKALIEALDRFPDEPRLLTKWANLPLRRSRRDIVCERWAMLAQRRPGWMDCDINIAMNFRMMGRLRDAAWTLRSAIARLGPHPALTILLCEFLEDAAEFDDAVRELLAFADARALFAAPDNALDLLCRLLEQTSRFDDFSNLIRLALHAPEAQRGRLDLFVTDYCYRSRARLAWLMHAVAAMESGGAADPAIETGVLRIRELVRIPRESCLYLPTSVDLAHAHLHDSAKRDLAPYSPLHKPAGGPDYSAFRLDRPIGGGWTREEEWRCEAFRIVQALNRFVGDRVLCAYQQRILTDGAWDLSVLLESSPLLFRGCLYYAVSKSIAYCFQNERERVWLITGGAANGFKIKAVFKEPERWFFRLSDDVVSGDEHRLIDDILATELPPFARDDARPRGAVIVSGYGNYAHYMWNELPALLEVLQWPPRSVTRAIVVAEPFGPFERLVHWPPDIPVTRTDDRSLMGSPRPQLHHDLLVVPGSTVVTKQTKQRVIALANELTSSNGIAFPRKSGRRILWVSLRLMYRHAINEQAFVVALAKRLAEDDLGYDLALDGFSLPWDIAFPGRYMPDYMRGHHKAVVELGARVTAAVRHAVGDRVKVFDWTSASLPEAISLAADVDFYVCHHGTQQHKIGWLYDVPGLIHANVALVAQGVNGEWPQLQADSSVQPIYFPGRFIVDAQTRNERQEYPYFRDYAFADIDGLVDFVVAQMALAGADPADARGGV